MLWQCGESGRPDITENGGTIELGTNVTLDHSTQIREVYLEE